MNVPQTTAPTTNRKINTTMLLVILSALSAFGPLATDMYLSSFSLLAAEYHTTMAMVSMSLSAYFLGLAGGQLLYGPLIDRFGRKPLLLLGILIFSLTSLLLIFAPSIHTFVALRLFQAIGGCAGMVIARAIISDLYEEREAARFFSLMMIITVIAPIIAPTLGGYLIATSGWKAIFIFLTVFGLICFVVTQTELPETLPHNQMKRATFKSILKTYARLLVKRHFILPSLVCAISYGELFSFISGSPFVYMTLHGVKPEHYGLLFSINAVGTIFAAKANHSLLKHTAPLKILWACVGSNLFFAFILVCFAAKASLPVLIFLLLLALIGIPAIGANAMALAMSACPDKKGSSSALLGVLQFGVASFASASVGFFHNGTVYPMVGLILACSLLAAALLLVDRAAQRYKK